MLYMKPGSWAVNDRRLGSACDPLPFPSRTRHEKVETPLQMLNGGGAARRLAHCGEAWNTLAVGPHEKFRKSTLHIKINILHCHKFTASCR